MRTWTFIERARRSVLIQVAVAVCLLLQLSEAAHFILVDHAICAEHGEMVHVTTPHRSFERIHGVARGSDASRAVSPGESQASAEHEHCPLAPNGTSRLLVVAIPSHDVAATAFQALAPPASTVVGLSPSALRLLAPKTSPPV